MTKFIAWVTGAAALAAAAIGSPAAGETPIRASASATPFNPRAAELFARDWVLNDWALRAFDSDRDVELSPAEASAAAQAFKRIADADDDGRVTPREYTEARAFILARY